MFSSPKITQPCSVGRQRQRSAPLLWALLLCSFGGCGTEGEPNPGYSDPCLTPMGSVLDCPANAQLSPQTSLGGACQKLVACGILAQEYLQRSGTECTDASDCSSDGECLQTDNGPRCHYHQLDYLWCFKRLAIGGSDPCDPDRRHPFTTDQLLQIAGCIAKTPCDALGLRLAEKLVSREERSEADRYTCKDGTETTWTATVCDFGLLEY